MFTTDLSLYTFTAGFSLSASYSVLNISNSGTIYTLHYSSRNTYNYATISTSYYESNYTMNSGRIAASNYECNETINSGIIDITCKGIISLNKFQLKDNGALIINGFTITVENSLDPLLKQYMEQLGGTITKVDDSVIFEGKFLVDYQEMKTALPHLFGKYDKAAAGTEYIPTNWFSSSYDRVSSKSKVTGKEKLWRFKDIKTLSSAVREVFIGKLSNKLVNSNLAPKVKLDVFSKAIVIRESSNQSTTIKETNNTDVLFNYIVRVMTNKNPEQVLKLLNNPLIASKTNNTSFFGSFFNSKPQVNSLIPSGVSKSDLVKVLKEVVAAISKDNFILCSDIKTKIVKELDKVNCKFTQVEIDDTILPEIDMLIETVKSNIEITSKLISQLEQEIAADNFNNAEPDASASKITFRP